MKNFILIFTLLSGFNAMASELKEVLDLGVTLQLFNQELSELNSNSLKNVPRLADDIRVLDARDGQLKADLLAREAKLTPQQKMAEQLPAYQAGARGYAADLAEKEWLRLVSELDISSHNVLVFVLLEQYHDPNTSTEDRIRIDRVLTAIDGVVAPQLEVVKGRSDLANTPGVAIGAGLALYTSASLTLFSAKYVQLMCLKYNFKNCAQFINKPWKFWFKQHARLIPEDHRLGYSPQPKPVVAGYLEYKQGTVKSMLTRMKTWRPKAISSQLLVMSMIGGMAYAAGDLATARYTEQKVPAKALLRLTQVHRACDLSQLLVEFSNACAASGETCKDPKKSLEKLSELVGESSVLTSSYSDLGNLDVNQVKADAKNLLNAIPEKHQKLFGRLLHSQGSELAPLCQRLALNDMALGHLIDNSTLRPKLEAVQAAEAAAAAATAPASAVGSEPAAPALAPNSKKPTTAKPGAFLPPQPAGEMVIIRK